MAVDLLPTMPSAVGVETCVTQCFGPILAQIDPNSDIAGGRFGVMETQRLLLERQHLWLVDLIDGADRIPRQPPSPRV